MVCTILDNLGKYFGKGKRKLLMDRFLVFFQSYIFEKSYILMDLEFMLLDTFDAIRPKQCPKVDSFTHAQEIIRQIRDAEKE